MLEELNKKCEAAMMALTADLGGLRTGRASAALVDNLMVDVYGAKTPLKQVAQVMVTDATSIAIQPWDKSNIQGIEKSIRESELNLNPVNDGITIRLNLPPMTSERREELVKLAKQKSEGGKIAIRNARQDILSIIDRQLKDKQIGEDDKSRLEKQVQEAVDKYNDRIEGLLKEKEAEIRTI